MNVELRIENDGRHSCEIANIIAALHLTCGLKQSV